MWKMEVREFTFAGGLGYVPVTFEGLDSANGYRLEVDGVELDQSVHGNDFWQSDFNPSSGKWSRTYNLPAKGAGVRKVSLIRR